MWRAFGHIWKMCRADSCQQGLMTGSLQAADCSDKARRRKHHAWPRWLRPHSPLSGNLSGPIMMLSCCRPRAAEVCNPGSAGKGLDWSTIKSSRRALHSLWHWRPCRRFHAAHSHPKWQATVNCLPQTCRASTKCFVSRSQVMQLHREGCGEHRLVIEACSTTAVGLHVTAQPAAAPCRAAGTCFSRWHAPAISLQLDFASAWLQLSSPVQPHLAAASRAIWTIKAADDCPTASDVPDSTAAFQHNMSSEPGWALLLPREDCRALSRGTDETLACSPSLTSVCSSLGHLLAQLAWRWHGPGQVHYCAVGAPPLHVKWKTALTSPASRQSPPGDAGAAAG